MQKSVALAMLALVCATAQSAAQSDGDRTSRRLYDRQTDCAVFDTPAFPADRATWDGPCVHGLAGGRGTATYFAADGRSETISAIFADGVVGDDKASIDWSDGAHYAGDVVDGAPDGAGLLIDAKGNRFDGQWRHGKLNGPGTVTWTNGDRYVGDWVDGKAEGHGAQTWADGRKYDGEWRDDEPDGHGVVTAKDGSTAAAVFVHGKRQEAAAPVPPSPASAPAVAAANGSPRMLDAFVGQTLIGVDGAAVSFVADGATIVRRSTGADGTVERMRFDYAGTGLGTVSDDSAKAVGVFRETPDGLIVEYGDGRTETLTSSGDGLSSVAREPAGTRACAAWYPKGHVFSAAERQAAVAAYARRLGVAGTVPLDTCEPATATPAGSRRVPTRRHGVSPQASLTPPPAVAVPAVVTELAPVPVRDSKVHLIDAAPGDGDEAVASKCLKVESDGSYWGFRNHCGYAVQFAYCLLNGPDRMTSCGAGDGVAGSVSANGFGALFSDESLAERDVDHDFRWVGCRGGAGEVAAHLDTPEPASGHCTRSNRTLAREN